MILSSPEKSIVVTLAYSHVFDFALSQEEILKRLVVLGKKSFSRKEIINTCQVLVDRGVVFEKDGFFALKGYEKTIDLRQKKQKFVDQKLAEAKAFAQIAKKIPWVQAVVVTGSLAAGNARENDDIDFLIISSVGRLWLVRPLILLLASIKGKRREQDGNHRDNSWCFNMFLDESQLKMGQKRRSIYTAFEVLQSQWVFDRGGVESCFLRENYWVKLALSSFWEEKQVVQKNRHKSPSPKNWWEFLLNLFNRVSFGLQFLYMKPKITREKVGLNYAFFHPRNTRQIIKQKWLQIVQKVTGQKIVLVTGVFDVLHQEHLNFLKKAKKAGDVLLVGVESDVRVKQMKGENRPINSQEKRCEALEKIVEGYGNNKKKSFLIDRVFVLPEEFAKRENHLELMRKLRPNILAVSSHTLHLDKKRSVLEECGGRVVVVHQENPEVSTSGILSGN